jgi:peptidyl-prolyl cis-trans isomerase B (cyclophilin B)
MAGRERLGIILAPMPRALSALLAVLAVAVVAGCGGGSGGGGSSSSSSAGTSTVVTAGAAIPPGCKRVSDPGTRQEETHEKRPPARLRSASASVVIQTTCGSFTIRLAVGQAPKTAASFATLVKRGFYDRLTFHRVATDPSGGPFVIQGGDPLGNGLGGPGYSVREKPPASLKYTKYTVAMAKTAAEPSGTSGSQFFIVTAADAGLSPQYALVGKVTSGQDVVDRISKMPTADNEQPIVPVVIQKATLQGA